MGIKSIPFSLLKTELERIPNECAESGETIIVEMPDQRLLVIQSSDLADDDSLIDEILASNRKFQDLVAKSDASPRNRLRYFSFTGLAPPLTD